MSLRVDHVMVGVRDLDAAGERIRDQLGLKSYDGGRHAGRGTANRIVPLGDAYIELISVVDREEAAASPLAALLESREDGFVTWCVATDDLDAVSSRLRTDAAPMSRSLPGGTTLRWRLTGTEAAFAQPPLPFFIQWDVPRELHPGRAAAHGGEISWIELGGDRARLEEWVGDTTLPLRYVDGPAGVRAVGIQTARGQVELRY